MRYTEIETLKGVGPAAAKRLRAEGILCVEALSLLSAYELDRRTKLGEGTSEKLVKNAREMLGFGTLDTGSVREDELLRRNRLTTGLPKLDDALMGGLETGSVVELYGSSRSGKSQWCHQLAVTSLLPESRKGLGGNVLWIDTETSFRPRTIRANALRWGLDPDISLDRIFVSTVMNQDQMVADVDSLPRFIVENDISMIIIDNLGGFFRFEVCPYSELRYQSQILIDTFRVLRGVAQLLHCVVLYTNQVYNRITTYGGNPTAPVGDPILDHQPTHRFYTRVGRVGKKKIAMKHSPGLPEVDVETYLGWGGFYMDSSEMKRTESAILPYLDTLPQSSQDTVAEEGAA